MRLSLLLFFTIICFDAKSQNSNNIQRKQLFDYDWKFQLGDEKGNRNPDFDDSNWRKINLPHDWSIEGIPEMKNPTKGAGGYFPTGKAWYRKTFKVPASWKSKKISIYFEGVYMNSEVFINGKSLGIYPYGYSGFSYDLSPYLNYNGNNVIAVKVDNSQQLNCRWYSGSGIYRHVWLNVTNPIHIDDRLSFITTPVVDINHATVRVKTLVKNETSSTQNILLSTQIKDKSNKSVAKNDVNVELAANSEREVEQIIAVRHQTLWSIENPYLYNLESKIVQHHKTLDEHKKSFGIRTIKFSTEKGFELNGKTILLNGGCLHHDNGCLGAKAYDRAEERKVELLKKAGFNAVRTSHNIPAEAFLDACDRLGLLVIDEAFDGWRESKTPFDYSIYFDKWWKSDLEAMVLRDRNHSSVIMWSIGNEIIERKKPEAVETAKMLANAIHEMDTTRPVTSAMTTWDKDWEIFDPLFAAHDVGGYNYELYRAETDHKRVPSRIMVQTESYPKDAFANWKLVKNHTYIIGDFVWTAMDYLGESGIGRYYYPGEPKGEHWSGELFPWHGAYCGDIDLLGWRKPISHYRSMLYNENEKLYIAVKEPNPDNGPIKLTKWAVWPTWENWTWPEKEGKDMEVEIYARYDSVKLYLNDKFIGQKPTTEAQEFKAVFTIPYQPGTLKAVGIENGKEVESKILKTAGNPSKIELKADRTEITANGEDLSYIIIEIKDKEGNLVTNAANAITITVDGAGFIEGIDNANLKEVKSYVGNKINVWNGRAMVVIKSTLKAGKIKVNASSADLPVTEITITSFK